MKGEAMASIKETDTEKNLHVFILRHILNYLLKTGKIHEIDNIHFSSYHFLKERLKQYDRRK
jgi:hypothetical protein